MKKIKLASLFLFGMFVFACENAAAQTQEYTDTSQTQTTTTDPNMTTEPTNVTIDTTGTGTSTNYGTTNTTGTTGREPSTKIHIYSGKHDGNNTINPDPKN